MKEKFNDNYFPPLVEIIKIKLEKGVASSNVGDFPSGGDGFSDDSNSFEPSNFI